MYFSSCIYSWTSWGHWYVGWSRFWTRKVLLDCFYAKALRFVYNLVLVLVLFLPTGIYEYLSWYLCYLLSLYVAVCVSLMTLKTFLLLAHLYGFFDHLALFLRPFPSCGCDLIIIGMPLIQLIFHLDSWFLVHRMYWSFPF